METPKRGMKMFWTLFGALVLATGRPGVGPLLCVDLCYCDTFLPMKTRRLFACFLLVFVLFVNISAPVNDYPRCTLFY